MFQVLKPGKWASKGRSVPWWNEELTTLCKKALELRRRYQRTTTNADLRQERRLRYQESNRTYQAKLREAKLKSWKDFCTGTDSSNPWNSVYWFAARKTRGALTLSTLKANTNTHTANILSTLYQLMDYFIPEDTGVQRRSLPQTSKANDYRTYAYSKLHSIYTTRSTGCFKNVWLMEGSRRRCPNKRDTSSGLQVLPHLFSQKYTMNVYIGDTFHSIGRDQ